MVRSDRDGLDFFGNLSEDASDTGEVGVEATGSDSSLLWPSGAESDCNEFWRVRREWLLDVEATEVCRWCCWPDLA